MTNILHISYDLRDRENRKVTKAVQNLIENTRSFSEPVVIDLMRVVSLKKEKIEIDNRGYLSVSVFGLPYSLFLRSHLNRAYSFIKTAEEKKLISFDNIEAVHAHKLTFEGYIAYQISSRLKVPLILTLRNTDFRMLEYRRDFLPLYKKIMRSAYKIIYLVPSMLELLKALFGLEFYNRQLKHKLVHIPNIIVRRNYESITPDEPHLLTALSFTKRDVKGKNLKNLLKAVSEIDQLDVKLKIAGSGIYERVVRDWIYNLKIEDKVELLGYIPNDEMDKYFSSAAAFVLPSFRESFGMVYAESLFNGTPILCSKGVLGFDGFFENVGVAVDPYSVKDIRRGIIELVTNNTFFRNQIALLKEAGAFNIFNPESVINTYREMLSEINHPGSKVLSY